MSPGPDMLLIASRSVSQGRVVGFATLAGIQAGTYCHALAAALGLSQLFLIVPVAYDIVRYADVSRHPEWSRPKGGTVERPALISASTKAGPSTPPRRARLRSG